MINTILDTILQNLFSVRNNKNNDTSIARYFYWPHTGFVCSVHTEPDNEPDL